MGETACFVHLSNPSDISHEDSEATQAPDGSISFGRFAADSLAWEKWSSFSHNRYLEEVERYKNPGSVAQKKAYFEAHYKRIAAQRAAKLLEQSNAASSNVPDSDRADLIRSEVEPEIGDGASNGNGNQHYESSNLGRYRIDQSHIVNSSNQFAESDNYVPVDKPEEVKGSAVDSSFSLVVNESDSDEKLADSETKMAEETVSVREEIFTESQTQNGPSQQIGDIENHSTVSELETSKTNQVGKPPLKESLAANQEIPDGNKKKQTGVSSRKSSDLCRNSKIPPAPPAAPIYSRKENIATRSPWDSVDKKRSTPNSLHMSLNFAPSHSTETFPSKTNQRVLVLDKIGDSKTSVELSKPSDDCSKSSNPPTKISSNGGQNHATAAPRLENRRKNTLQENQIVQSQKKDRKLFSLSVDSSRSSNHKGIKAGFKFLSCFNLRSEERATTQKELEERANAKEGEKVKLQPKFKEEAKFELKKLHQILCFKAKPMPDFYHETEPTKNDLKKILLTRPRSPKLGRKTNASPVQDGTSLPPRQPVKSDGSKTTIASFLNKKTH